MKNEVGTLLVAEVDPGLAAGCFNPPCRITPYRDDHVDQNVYVHCDDANPEHWLRLSDAQMFDPGTPSVTDQVHGWVWRMHAWERMNHVRSAVEGHSANA